MSKNTKTMRSTNSPYWNEVFFFNFNSSPANLFEETIEFQVYNSLKYLKDALIGSFKLDIGYVHDELNHSLINKWLLLGDAEDCMSGAKGYLKVSINVLGPGDEAPVNIFINLVKFLISLKNFISTRQILIRRSKMILKGILSKLKKIMKQKFD